MCMFLAIRHNQRLCGAGLSSYNRGAARLRSSARCCVNRRMNCKHTVECVTRWFLCSMEPSRQPEARRVGIWRGPIERPSIDPTRRTRPGRSMPLPG
jgi:hypothetical protein